MQEVYLDNNATTRPDPAVIRAMLPYLENQYGNPSSLHEKGAEAERAVKKSRKTIARILGIKATEIIFTSGATESDNLAIKGAARALGHRGNHIITTAVEHPAVLQPCRELEREGFRVDYLEVTKNGIDPEKLKALTNPKTILVSIMHVNNETGQILLTGEIIKAIRNYSLLNPNYPLLLHSDGAQALGKIKANLKDIDLYSLSGHKIHGPKGVGGLYVKDSREELNVEGVRVIREVRPMALRPLLTGGGQESGLRSGTENVPGIIGFAKAVELAYKDFDKKQRYFKKLKTIFWGGLKDIPNLVINSPENSADTTINISIPPISGENLAKALGKRGIYIGTGSACASKKSVKNPTLTAMHLPRAIINSSVRVSFSRFNTEEEVARAVKAIRETLK